VDAGAGPAHTDKENRMKCTEHPPRRRWARVGAVGLAAATAITLAAGAAHAIPPGDDDPPQPPPTGSLVISGNVSLTGCPGVTRDRVTVIAVSTNPDSGAGGSVRVSSTGSYRITDLPRGTYHVVPRLDAGLCPYGAWSPTSRQVSAPAIGVSFTYRGPVRKLRLPATGIASVLNLAVQGSGLHLDNYGPRHGQSFQLDNGSWLRWGGTPRPFTLPEIQYDLDCGWICPDLGQARFYVNDLNMTSLAVGWGSPSFRATLAFESNGREVKGWYTDALIGGGPYDSLMPDVHIDNGRLAVALTPVAEGGRLSYRVASVSLSASIQATGACNLPVVGNVCDLITDYKGKVKSAIESGVRAKLSDGAVRAVVAAALDNHLTKLGMPTVDRVFIEGNDIVLVAYS
jgi:hypothetical protein